MAALFSVAGCSNTVDLYHRYQGGAIATARQAPPGAAAPYPNLDAVPAAPVALTPAQTAAVARRVAGVPLPAAPALAGPTLPGPALPGPALPGAVPPLPALTGLSVPVIETAPPPASVAETPVPAASAAVPVARPAAPPVCPPILLAFAPDSAILTPQTVTALRALAVARGDGRVIAGGFGETGLALGVARARAIADQLTAAGVPAQAITLTAAAGGSGGFAELVY